MSCTRISELLPLYISRDLDASEMEAVGQHLLSCEPCRSLESQYREADSWLKSLSEVEPEIPVNGELKTRVNRKIDTLETKEIGWKVVVFAGAVAAAMLITSAFALTIYTRTDESHPVAPSVAVIRQDAVQHTVSPAVPMVNKKRSATRHVSRTNLNRRNSVPPCTLSETADLNRDAEMATRTPMRIEIQTSDPNIRIIWLTSDNGGIE